MPRLEKLLSLKECADARGGPERESFVVYDGLSEMRDDHIICRLASNVVIASRRPQKKTIYGDGISIGFRAPAKMELEQ